MDATIGRWSKRPNSTIGQRNVDKELERVKSLAVVSVLNKSFEKEGTPPSSRSSSLMVAPVLSPSSSPTTNNETVEAISNRHRTVSYSSTDYLSKKSSNSSLHSDFKQNIPPSSTTTTTKATDVRNLSSSLGQLQDIVNNNQSALAEKESNTDSFFLVDTEKETLQKRIQELEELYVESLQELKVVTAGNDTQMELVMLQDQLIQNMSSQLEEALTAMQTTTEDTQEISGTSIQLDTEEGKNALVAAQQELALLKNELLDFKSVKTHYETMIMDMTEQLSAYDAKVNDMEKVAKDIQKDHTKQIEYIDNIVQTLVDRLRETNETINRLQVEHIQEKQALIATYEQQQQQANTINNVNSSSKSINDSSTVIWENEEGGGMDSRRSSLISTASRTNSQKHKSFIARWKGSPIPPATPPPSVPLPPVPSKSSNNRPRSTISEIYATTSTISTQNKHISMDAVGGIGSRRRPSNQSELEVQITDAAYYKEFTDQLQERLSISKEIDDLRVWEPSDYDAIQKKIESKDWSSGDDNSSHHNRDSAFWKGMKKKLRV